MTLITNYSLLAERRRGLIFAENFVSNSEILRNEGSISGSIASYPSLSGVKTAIAKLKQVDSASNTVKLNASNTITITAGNLFGSFTNAGGILADDIQIDDYTKFEYVKIFNQELTSQELTDYQNNSTFRYFNEALVHLPFTSKTHDPDNNQTLDLKGVANMTFGNGVASTTFPTKSKERGYSSDGGDTLRFAGNPFKTTDTNITFSAVIRPFSLSTGQVIASIEDGLIAGALILLGLNKISFFSGTSVAAHESKFENLPLTTKELFVIVGVNDSVNGFTRIYVNGDQGVDASSPVNPGFTNDMTFQAFARGNFSTQPALNGTKLLQLTLWNKALTPMQIQDFTINSIADYNKT